MKRCLFFFGLIFSAPCLQAGEGMWIPLLLENNVITDMQAAGLKLSADDIYDITQASLKDAVVMFGRGCTGEIISPDGLLITNHHCAYGRIQAHSTVGKNLLTEGFWAYSRDQELPNPGLTVSFLIRIEDITEKVLSRVRPEMTETERAAVIDEASRSIVANAIENTHYEASVESFYFGRDFYLFIYEVFRDVRLVGNPPSSIAEFGGDTDNWIWPRHRGDFSLFRVYAGKDNKPAGYSPDNVPYRPKKYLTICKKGIKEGDFTMILGYPARTEEYLHSEGLAMLVQDILPAKINMREERLRIMSEEMSKSPMTKLQYANKYQGVSNAWKKWVGVVEGAERTGVIRKRSGKEYMLVHRPTVDSVQSACFSLVLQNLADFYRMNRPGFIASSLGSEAMESFEMIRFASDFVNHSMNALHQDTIRYAELRDQLKKKADVFFSNVNLTIDKRIMPGILSVYFNSVDPAFLPETYYTIKNRYSGDASAYIMQLYEKSIFTDSVRLYRYINHLSVKSLKKFYSDPATLFYRDFSDIFYPYFLKADSLDQVQQRLYRDYLGALMKWDTGHLYYPDANFTMRVTYGKVEGYKAKDAVWYKYTTTTKGILEKGNLEIDDYRVNDKLKQLIENKDYGSYASDSAMPVCFIASNHTSGGNSGSPVLNAEGQMIGINFDRNWEGTISDYEYDPAVCRNISLDIRYVLFVIDKVAGADNIMKELNIE
jgi:hypothetical protein